MNPTPTPLSPQEWRKEAERLIDDYASTPGTFGLNKKWDALLSHLDAHPFDQVVQEPVAWMWEYIGNDPLRDHFRPCARSFHEMDPKNPPHPKHWKPVAPLYAQPVRGEALPAEQPKSDQANLTAPVPSEGLQTALRDAIMAFHLAEFAEVRSDGSYQLCREEHADAVIFVRSQWRKVLIALAACEASAEARPSNKKAPESSSASPVEAVEVLQQALHALLWATTVGVKSKDCTPAYDAIKTITTFFRDRARTLVAQPPQPVQEDERERTRASDWGLTKGVAMSLKPFLRPGEKVIWREPFRWKDENGVLSNHYESASLAALAADFDYEIVEDFKHAAIIKPLAAISTTTKEN